MPERKFIKEIHRCNSQAFGGGDIGKDRQEKLYNLKVALVGTHFLGQSALACLYGLGVGNIYFLDNSSVAGENNQGFLFHGKSTFGRKKSDVVYEALAQINPDSRTKKRHGRFAEAFLYDFNPNIIIEATNDPSSKEKLIDYALSYSSRNIPIISLSSSHEKGAISCYWPNNRGRVKVFEENLDLESLLHEEFRGSSQGGFASGIVAGLAVEEIRKFAFKYGENDTNLENNLKLIYNLHSSTRKGTKNNIKTDNNLDYRKKKVLVAGAGALGNWACIYLSQLGLGQVDFVDYDSAEIKNLNRQVQLRGRIGDKKSVILSDRIKEIDPEIKSRAYVDKIEQIDPKTLLDQQYDAVLGCFDNKYARLWLDDFAVSNKIPYLDGGSHPKEGQLAVYVPGMTRSIREQLDLESFPETKSDACSGPNPSVVMSNAIIAGAMVGELVHVLDGNGNNIRERFNYSTSLSQRFYVEKRIER